MRGLGVLNREQYEVNPEEITVGFDDVRGVSLDLKRFITGWIAVCVINFNQIPALRDYNLIARLYESTC